MSKIKGSLEKFIEKHQSINGALFTYEKAVYNGCHSNIIITCNVHGDINRTPVSHFKNKGCPLCNKGKGYSNMVSNSIHKRGAEFFKNAIKKHKEKYDYSLSKYLNSYTDIKIICPIHGIFLQDPKHHLQSNGCWECGRESFKNIVRNKYSITELKIELSKLHNDKYCYSLLNLENYSTVNNTKVKIICPEHGVFEQRLKTHIDGSGCNKCRYFGYTRTKYIENCKLKGHEYSKYYCVRFFNDFESFYKLGITVQDMSRRYRKAGINSPYSYEVIFTYELSPEIAWDTERSYKSKFIPYKYQPLNFFPGSTECFNLELPINEIINELEKLKL